MIGWLERNYLMLYVIGLIIYIKIFFYKIFRILKIKFLFLRYKMVWLSCILYESNFLCLVGVLGIVLLGLLVEIVKIICIIIYFMYVVI